MSSNKEQHNSFCESTSIRQSQNFSCNNIDRSNHNDTRISPSRTPISQTSPRGVSSKAISQENSGSRHPTDSTLAMSGPHFSLPSYEERAQMPVDRDSVMAQIDTRFEKDYRIGWPKNSLLSWPVASETIQDDSNDISGRKYGKVEKLINQAGFSAGVYYAF